MRGLIFGTMYVYGQQSADLAANWARCNVRCNPGWHLALIDSASYRQGGFRNEMLDAFEYVPVGRDIEVGMNLPSDRVLVSFSDNVGHLAKGGGDGWGRAFCQGLQLAIDNHFDYVAHVEADVLSSVDWRKGIEVLRGCDKAVLSTPDPHYRCLETGLMLFRTSWLIESGFIDRYSWQTKRQGDLPEDEVADLCVDQLKMVDIPGCRNDADALRDSDIDKLLYLTHCKDDRLYSRFMRRFV